MNFVNTKPDQKLDRTNQQDVAHLRFQAQRQEHDVEGGVAGSSIRALASEARLSIASYNLPLRRYLRKLNIYSIQRLRGRGEKVLCRQSIATGAPTPQPTIFSSVLAVEVTLKRLAELKAQQAYPGNTQLT